MRYNLPVARLAHLHVQVVNRHEDLAVLTGRRHLGTGSLLIVGHDAVLLRLHLLEFFLFTRDHIYHGHHLLRLLLLL